MASMTTLSWKLMVARGSALERMDCRRPVNDIINTADKIENMSNKYVVFTSRICAQFKFVEFSYTKFQMQK